MALDISVIMAAIFGAILFVLWIFSYTLTVKDSGGTWLSIENKSKREFEIFALGYSVVWVGVFGYVIVTQAYEEFNEDSYMTLCVTLALPFLLQPIIYPFPAESKLPLFSRYSFKANLWIAIFSFIGNYWYTHYFYNVLTAKYTLPSWRLNDVPIPLFFATHFYFMLYHTLSNMLLRKICTRYAPSIYRTIFYGLTIFSFSYFTAFMETLSISSFPYYSFKQDRDIVYTIGSAFYGIYFIISYPVFFEVDEVITKTKLPYTAYQTVMEAMGASMIVLCLLDITRLFLGIPLIITDKLVYLYLQQKEPNA